MNTSSGYTALDGTCTIDSSTNTCTSYSSNSLGAGTINNLPSTPGYTLHFKVSWGSGPTQTQYTIKANASGTNYSGKANDGKKRQDETWAATSTAEPAVAAKAK